MRNVDAPSTVVEPIESNAGLISGTARAATGTPAGSSTEPSGAILAP